MPAKCSIFIDAGYLLASAAYRLTGTSLRSGIHVKYGALVKGLIRQAEEATGLQVLRVHWYDSAKDGVPDRSQERIGELPKVKLRLGRFGYDGQQKGVDLRLGLDMVTHARNHAAEVFLLISGDDDLTEAVEDVQIHGVSVVVLAVPGMDGQPHGVSRHLVRAADEIITISPKIIDNVVIPIETPEHGDEEGGEYEVPRLVDGGFVLSMPGGKTAILPTPGSGGGLGGGATLGPISRIPASHGIGVVAAASGLGSFGTSAVGSSAAVGSTAAGSAAGVVGAGTGAATLGAAQTGAGEPGVMPDETQAPESQAEPHILLPSEVRVAENLDALVTEIVLPTADIGAFSVGEAGPGAPGAGTANFDDVSRGTSASAGAIDIFSLLAESSLHLGGDQEHSQATPTPNSGASVLGITESLSGSAGEHTVVEGASDKTDRTAGEMSAITEQTTTGLTAPEQTSSEQTPTGQTGAEQAENQPQQPITLSEAGPALPQDHAAHSEHGGGDYRNPAETSETAGHQVGNAGLDGPARRLRPNPGAIAAALSRTVPTPRATTPVPGRPSLVQRPLRPVYSTGPEKALPPGTWAHQWEDSMEQVVRRVLGSLVKSTTIKNWDIIALGRPSIPQEIDKALLLDATEAMGVYTLSDAERHEVRAAFWREFDKITR